jgi:hypothetical protein
MSVDFGLAEILAGWYQGSPLDKAVRLDPFGVGQGGDFDPLLANWGKSTQQVIILGVWSTRELWIGNARTLG